MFVIYKDLVTDALKSTTVDNVREISQVKRKKAVTPFQPKNILDFTPRKDYARIKSEHDGMFVYRIWILAMAESKEDLEKMKNEGRIKAPSVPKSKQGLRKEPYINYLQGKERDSATEEIAARKLAKQLGQSLAQDQLSEKLCKQTSSVSQKTSGKTTVSASNSNIHEPRKMETESKEGDNKVLSSAGNAHVQVEPTTPLQNTDFKKTPFQFSFKKDKTKRLFDFYGFGVNSELVRGAPGGKESVDNISQDSSSPPAENISGGNSSNISASPPSDTRTQQMENIEKKIDCTSCCPCVKAILERLTCIEGLLAGRARQPPDTEVPQQTVAGYVDLGQGKAMAKQSLEKIMSTEETLQTKLTLIINNIFKPEELKKLFLKRTKSMGEEGSLFPSECIKTIEEAINEANKEVAKKDLIRKHSKRINSLVDPLQLQSELQRIDELTSAQAVDVKEKDIRRIISRILSNTRNEVDRESNEDKKRIKTDQTLNTEDPNPKVDKEGNESFEMTLGN